MPTSRRNFLAAGIALGGWHLARPLSSFGASDPFTLGIASGDPLPDGVVLWTRLAPDPLHGGGMPPEPVAVDWEIAEDEKLARVVQRGTAQARPEFAHAVHVDVRGLQPARWYWYRFRAGGAESPLGRTRTAPLAGAAVPRLSFAFASCQHYEQGYYVAYRHMAQENLDLVIHLGDYIYEGPTRTDRVRRHNSDEIETLTDYRNRYALYKGDPDLQRAHALFPWILTWDDHEVDNNYAGDIEEHGAPRQQFLERRANAYQAYYEHMPLRETSLPQGSHLLLYRRLGFGSLAEFSVLDTRQYRTDQPCGDGVKPSCPERFNPAATLMGAQQDAWLRQGLDRSQARWNVIAQQVMMAEVDRQPGPGERFSMDQWSGYPVARDRLLRFLGERRPSNPIVISGDIHSNWVADLKADLGGWRSAVVASEFVGTSITSGGDGADTIRFQWLYQLENPHIKFFNNQRGYVRVTLTPDLWRSDYRVMSAVTRQDASIRTRASYVVENGKRGVQED